ncbi:phospholipid/cholesterol/gamma-HCH transport system permease protein [Chitinophaga terrae (ex Kim and Jung 2007)]|jgi:phospholipid/cholesterol/gamma-HCH transport system permease protein|uniref:MlaE family ABC transporter permease n=1 Tax=Chitinophaga terrae (ex Kim and Jung 2007) TaxID=408074 RepID=UPI0027810656|nr:ABC transporter permease [Chitinophaga terrae (ex Kim and Jung 2007)]MDQ0108467.1 phospholipid/cholesterol/gamma-HCH transport system permease protein [Chitinophaga terrae (ex Kim and Jung 2007)]
MSSTNGKSDKPVINGKIDRFFLNFYNIFDFIRRLVREAVRPPIEWGEFIRQCYQVGYKSLALVTVTGFITGVVFTEQSRPTLSEFGVTAWLPSLVAIAVVRALAPLIAALICAGKVGSSIGAELASMKVTEQIDAMEVSAINPFRYLVVTRVIAMTVCLPILMFYNALIGCMGSYFDVHAHEQTSLVAFFDNAFAQITFLDYTTALTKSIVYGFTIGVVSCYQGFNATQGTLGVGKAANISVVVSMFLIFIEEVIIVHIFNSIR